jgi:hypothetical protein
LGAGGATRQRSCDYCAAKRFIERSIGIQRSDQCTCECITCAGCIDGTNAWRLDTQHIAAMGGKRALAAQGHDDRQTRHRARRGERKLMRRRRPITAC